MKTQYKATKLKLFFFVILSISASTELFATNFCGTITANTTWTAAGSPYIITCNSFVQGAAAPVLTINDTVVVKFNAGTSLVVGQSNPGGIKILGTGGANNGVTLKSNLGTQAPGDWNGLQLFPQTTAASGLNFVTIKHAVNGLTLNNTSIGVDHVTLQDNSSFGIVFTGIGNPNIIQANFSSNGLGAVSNSNPSNVIKVLYSWWNHASGPSCSGCPGSGQSVSTGVTYEPWLTGIPSDTNYFDTFSMLNRTFNPNIGAKVTINFTTTKTGNWTTTILNGSSQTVRTFTGTGTSSGSVQWDGKNQSGVVQPNGTYTYKLEATSNQGKVATPANGYTLVDSTKDLLVTNLAANPLYFSPNNDGIQDTTTVTANINYDDAGWTLNFKNGGGTVVRTTNGNGPIVSYVWNGKNAGGTTQPDGVYTVELIATEGTSSVTQTSTTIIDRTIPASNITQPTNGSTVSNVFQNGSTDKPIIGTATDANFSDFILEYGVGSVPSVWTVIPDVGGQVTNGTLGIWATENIPNAPTMSLRLKVFDLSGNSSTTSKTVTLGNYKITQNKLEFNGFAAQTVTYTSTIPFLPFTETIKIYKEPSKTTLIKTLRNSYSHPTTGNVSIDWNGTKTTGALAADGPYFMFADVSSGGSSMTWDKSNQPLSSSLVQLEDFVYSSFEPYRNQPLTFTYNLTQPGRVRIIYAKQLEPECFPGGDGCCHAYDDCVGLFTPPWTDQECVVENKYEESGSHTVRWAGVDNEGRYRNDFRCVTVVSRHITPPDYPLDSFGGFAKNAVVLFGTKVIITNFAVNPPLYGPWTGNLQVNFTLSKEADIEVTFLNQECATADPGANCILRTLNNNDKPAGPNTMLWDGKADNGVWVAAGPYLVTLKATDNEGNIVTEQILTTVRY